LKRLEQSSALAHLLFEPAEHLSAEHQLGLAASWNLSTPAVQAQQLD
jgi:hypothetical protein